MPRKTLEPVLLEPKPEQAPQPQFPHLNIQFIPAGVLVQNMLGPGMSFNTVIAPDAMDELCKQWRELRKQQLAEMQTIAAVRKSKNPQA